MRDTISLLVNNLTHLGIIEYAERQHSIIISSRTFLALENHKRAAEVIFYALFRLLDTADCRQRLSPLFPCTDGRMAKEFRNSLFKWLSELKRSTTILSTSTVRRSLLDECAGERYEDLLFQFSSHLYLLQLRTRRNHVHNFQSSWQVACNSNTTYEDLVVHDLIQTYRLCKLRENRMQYTRIYNDFVSHLSEQEDEQRRVATRLRPQMDIDVLQLVETQISRIAKTTSSTICIDLFRPVPISLDPFYTSLPWQVKRMKHVRDESKKRELFTDRQQAKLRLEALQQQIEKLPPVPSKQAAAKIREDVETTPAIGTVAIPSTVFHRKGYDYYKDQLADQLASFEPGYQETIIDQSIMDHMRQLTPAKPVTTSFLPRRINNRQVKPVSDSLQRTLLKSRIKTMKLSTFDEEEDTELPSTPLRKTGSEQVTSTAKTINRLINVLNESDTSMHKSYDDKTPTKNINRRLESSFSLWSAHD